jgi:peptide chain release factor 1
MKIDKSDLKVETMRGTGPGGQHRNKTDSAVRITHIPTGTTAYADERSQHKSRRLAMQELRQRLRQKVETARAARKKARRDKVIHERDIIRTYDYKSGMVRDHRTRKKASLKDVLEKGRIELLQ